MPGEAGSIFLKEEKVGPVELATISFGQRFEITPIQMLSLVSTIANNGKKFTPRIVKAIIDSQTGERTNMQTLEGEQVISEATAKKVLSMMESVVAEGTGKNAGVKGYSIGGKTGTSEDGVNTGKYVTSFVGVADIKNPEVVILILLYNPTGEGGHQGGAIAAPIASQVLGEVLPYLEIQKQQTEEDMTQNIQMPKVTDLNIKEAKKILQDLDLEVQISGEGEFVVDQLPKKGIQINRGTKVTIYVQ